MSLFKKVLRVLGNTGRRKFAVLLVLMVFAAGLEVVGIGSVPVMLQAILQPDKLKQFPWVYNILKERDLLVTERLFVAAALIIVVIFIIKNVFRLFVDYTQIRLVRQTQIELSISLFSKYIRSPYALHLQRNSSVLVRNVQHEVSYVTSKVLLPLLLIMLNLIILFGIMVSLLVINSGLTFVLILSLGLTLGIFNLVVRKKLRNYGKIMQQERRTQLKYLYQGLQGFKAIKVANREKFFINLFETTTRRFSLVQERVNILERIPNAYTEVISVFLVLSMVAWMLMAGYENAALTYVLGFFGLALLRMRQNFSTIMTNINLVRSNEVSLDPVIADINMEDDRKLDENQNQISFLHNISFRQVNFHYPNTDKAVINNLDLEICKGQMIGVAGVTGGGKSTFIDLLLGLHLPSSGSILVDDQNIHLYLSSWQKKIGYVPQNIYLLDDSIASNIAFGVKKEKINETRLQEVIKEAQLEEMISSLPNGLATEVGENGVRLSGGQRQRIGIARALYHKPEVLILDEATSALDNETERKFMEMLYQMQRNLTVIMIAHRLTTLENCDKILFIKNGRIEVEGSYNHLLEVSTDFRTLALQPN
jgi:ATP-binding cassette subfamily C protein